MLRRLSLAYAAGLAAALVASIALWAFGHFGVLAKLHVAIAPVLGLYWLYARLIVGGLWGLQLVLPIGGSVFVRGIVLSLAPTLVTLLWIFPFQSGQGWLGRSEEHTSELQSLMRISYAVFCLKK